MALTGNPSSTQSDGSGDFVEGRLLDGFLLLAAGGSSSPEDVVSVNLSSLQIVEVAAEDLTFFGNLDSLDVSDNQLSDEAILDQFGRLPRLTRLLLSCNSISSLNVSPQCSLRLVETIDLSHNELHGDVLSQLAHLPRLVTLNLSSNCISSVPPEEELYGLQALEELSLDANDLVQFVQWRALEVLPRLRKLSLASNRVKRLKDDAPDAPNQPGEEITYFESLEELDLSQNEIAHVEHLPAVKLFRSLRKLILSNNPCTKTAGASEHSMRGVQTMIQDATPWYLCGSGSFMRREKATEPRLKLDRRKLKKVRQPRVGAGTKARALSSQLGVLDREANQLLVDLQGGYESRAIPAGESTTAIVPREQPREATLRPGSLPFDDDLSEEELARIFKEQTLKIEQAFNEPVEEPASFRRAPPFTLSRQEDEAAAAAANASLGHGGGAGAPNRGSSTFLTSTNEETRSQRFTPTRSMASVAETSVGGRHKQHESLGSSASGTSFPGFGATGEGETLALPPIGSAPGSRASSAGGISRSDPLDMLLSDTGARTKQMPDIGVREAMKALRAAAMSEYAVAA